MPNRTNYFVGYTAGTSIDTGSTVRLSTRWEQEYECISYEEYLQDCERQNRIMEQMMQEQAELEEDRRKYPLFYLKKGII